MKSFSNHYSVAKLANINKQKIRFDSMVMRFLCSSDHFNSNEFRQCFKITAQISAKRRCKMASSSRDLVLEGLWHHWTVFIFIFLCFKYLKTLTSRFSFLFLFSFSLQGHYHSDMHKQRHQYICWVCHLLCHWFYGT